jgi:hypothetical protein
MTDLIELRAALTQLAKALETERACVLRIMRIVERQMEEGEPEAVNAPSVFAVGARVVE